jgi:hypothetical protein
MSQILAIQGEVRNHPLTFEFVIEYNEGVGSRRTAPAQGIETFGTTGGPHPARSERHEGPPLRRGLKLFDRRNATAAKIVTKDRPCAGD